MTRIQSDWAFGFHSLRSVELGEALNEEKELRLGLGHHLGVRRSSGKDGGF